MTNMHWIAVAAGAALVIHSLKIYDLATIPGIGPMLAKFLTPFAPKPVNTNTVPNIPSEVVRVDTQPVGDRCNTLLLNLTALRHFVSEQVKETAVEGLDACNVLQGIVDTEHEKHSGNVVDVKGPTQYTTR